MALTQCRECNGQVSTEAAACPHCGAPQRPGIKTAPVKPKEKIGVIGKFAIFVFALIVVFSFVGSNSPSNRAQYDGQPPAAAANTCRENYKLCADNADVVDHNSTYSSARAACEVALEKSVRYGEPTYKGDHFGWFVKGDDYVKTGKATLVSEVALQNQFGAKENTKEYCDYDLETKQILRLHGGTNGLGGYWAAPNVTELENAIDARSLPVASKAPPESPPASTAPPTITQDPAAAAQPATPSFDCSKARSDAEQLICGDPGLAALDVKAARYYVTAKADVGKEIPGQMPEFMSESQSAWRERESSCHDKECLLTWYQGRFAKLAGWSAEAIAAKAAKQPHDKPAP